VPARFAPAINRAAMRWSVSARPLSAQLYAESGFNPFAVSSAGAQGIAQFMPGTARAFGLSDPFDAAAAINAQAHMMRDLLRRFGSVPLALAAYNAGPGVVGRCGCIPPYPETPRLRRAHPRPTRRRRRCRRAHRPRRALGEVSGVRLDSLGRKGHHPAALQQPANWARLAKE
jgi:soluble lytic murein transglycosylase-like protein